MSGDREWDDLYRENVGAFEAMAGATEPSWLRDLVIRETEAFQKLWDGNYRAAAASYGGLADDADQEEKSLGAWYRHWEGLCWQLANDTTAASYAFVLAANVRAELGRPATDGGVMINAERIETGFQAKNLATLLRKKRAQINAMLDKIEATLNYGPETKPTEQALAELGSLLGLTALRPDNDVRTGPDVMWLHDEQKSGIALEAKTDKDPKGMYRKKDDIGQFHDHIQWCDDEYPGYQLFKGIVGRRLPVTEDANPPEDLRLIPLEGFQELTSRLRKLFLYIQDSATGEDTAVSAERGLRHLGLIWPACVEALPSVLASDLKQIKESPG